MTHTELTRMPWTRYLVHHKKLRLANSWRRMSFSLAFMTLITYQKSWKLWFFAISGYFRRNHSFGAFGVATMYKMYKFFPKIGSFKIFRRYIFIYISWKNYTTVWILSAKDEISRPWKILVKYHKDMYSTSKLIKFIFHL